MKNNRYALGFYAGLITMAILVASPVSAIIAGLLAWLTPLTFWPTFAYTIIGCAMFNVVALFKNAPKLA